MAQTYACGSSSIVAPKRAVRGLVSISRKPSNFSRIAAYKGGRPSADRRRVSARATEENVDFDTVLSNIADKFEKSDSKAAIIGYSFAAFFALWFAEWFIHLPLIDFLLGGSVQLLGLVLLPYFGVKYFVDNDSITGDAGRAFDRVVKKLPGLEK